MGILLQIGEGLLLFIIGAVCVGLFVGWELLSHWLEMRRLAREREQAAVAFDNAKEFALRKATMHGANVSAGADQSLQVIYFYPTHTRIEAPATQEPLQLPEPELPGRCDLSEILERFRPSPQQILLGLAPGGELITVSMKELCHVALAGATGLGKSSLMRLLLAQLLFCGAQVLLADPHFAPVDAESGEDWRPIASRLAREPAVSYTHIKVTLKWIATDELPKRLDRRYHGEPVGSPLFLALDELPAIVKNVPNATDYMGDLLREGRKVHINVVSAATDFLVKTLGGNGAVRDCFRTAFYVGGDTTSARVLLDIKGRVDDGGLGKGIVMQRSMANLQAQLSRVPYASNESIAELLSIPLVPGHFPTTSRPLPGTTQLSNGNHAGKQAELDSETVRIVRKMIENHKSQNEIIQAAFPGMRNSEAIEQFRKCLASLVRVTMEEGA